MNTKPIEVAPKGMRWPWYPLYTGNATMGALTQGEPGTASVTLTMDGPLRKHRVGIRRWAKHIARREPTA